VAGSADSFHRAVHRRAAEVGLPKTVYKPKLGKNESRTGGELEQLNYLVPPHAMRAAIETTWVDEGGVHWKRWRTYGLSVQRQALTLPVAGLKISDAYGGCLSLEGDKS